MTQPRLLDMRRDGSVAVVALTNPPDNALESTMFADIRGLLPALREPEVRAVVITGRGGTFSVGVDPKELAMRSGVALRALAHEARHCLDAIEQMSKPVIAAIDGLCLGGGLELALACHLRVAGPGAQFALPELILGIIPALGGTRRLTHVVGPARAHEILLLGRRLSAREARRIGLVNAVAPADDVLTLGVRWAKRVASRQPAAVAAALASLRGGVVRGRRDRQAFEVGSFASLIESATVRDRLSALGAVRGRAAKVTDS